MHVGVDVQSLLKIVILFSTCVIVHSIVCVCVCVHVCVCVCVCCAQELC